MKFPGVHAEASERPSKAPDVTAEVMERLGFSDIDGSPCSLKRARRRYLLKRASLFLGMVLVILSAALIERGLSQEVISQQSIGQDQAAFAGASNANTLSALQAVIQRIDSVLSAAEAGEAPVGEHSEDQNQDVRPLEGPILVPGFFGDASASLTSS